MAASSQSQRKVSILVLGKTQSGKSSLVEFMKQYIDPTYTVNPSLLGNGNFSKTVTTQKFKLESTLPEYQIVKIRDGALANVVHLDELFDNEDEYRKLLNARKNEYILRPAPHDPCHVPAEMIEFNMLDTPGLNHTDENDSSHADDIIAEIIATRSFNLILILVNYQNAVAVEQQDALEYYSDVLTGLHANIAFLYTHIDYANCHPSNTIHYRDLQTKNKFLHYIFRRADNADGSKMNDRDAALKVENYEEYPSFAINFLKSMRPVTQCLIRNTLREILQLAVMNPPVVLDTSAENIKRIKSIVHPSRLNGAQRKE
ncbi:hypothetical protein BGZ81_001648 [Podila clonocystis]|nr:hypothetical protein BGZ81_001648 [Podila clonocystis]